MAEAQGYSKETVIVGRALQKDFEQRGVHLDSHGQSQALQMSQQIAVMGLHVGQSVITAQCGTGMLLLQKPLHQSHPCIAQSTAHASKGTKPV